MGLVKTYQQAPKNTSAQRQAAVQNFTNAIKSVDGGPRASSARADEIGCIISIFNYIDHQAQTTEDRARCSFTEPTDISCVQSGTDPYADGAWIEYVLNNCGVSTD